MKESGRGTQQPEGRLSRVNVLNVINLKSESTSTSLTFIDVKFMYLQTRIYGQARIRPVPDPTPELPQFLDLKG